MNGVYKVSKTKGFSVLCAGFVNSDSGGPSETPQTLVWPYVQLIRHYGK
jgi:hypothetical protein